MMIDERHRSLEPEEEISDSDRDALMPAKTAQWLAGSLPPSIRTDEIQSLRSKPDVLQRATSSRQDTVQGRVVMPTRRGSARTTHTRKSHSGPLAPLFQNSPSTNGGAFLGGIAAGLVGAVIGVFPALLLAFVGVVLGRLAGGWLDRRHGTVSG